jgi:2,3,4,5-tetrahydropyridine-2-carboxylate N-succinyltransferase
MSLTTSQVQQYFEDLAINTPSDMPGDFLHHFHSFLRHIEAGHLRAASRNEDGTWTTHGWVKRSILFGFKYGQNRPMKSAEPFWFSDKHTYPARSNFDSDMNTRIVPGGSSVRVGAYIGRNVTMMPPMYVNTGAYVDDGTMIDSHALVGSCAQVGKRVHLSAACQIGGVLEPINANPVIIEDDCMVGGNTGVYEGTIVRKGAVIGAGVVLTRSTPVFDIVRETIYKGTADEPLIIPEGAVVVPGSRPMQRNAYGSEMGLHISTPIIIKYRDDKTDAATTLEDLLR